MEKIIYNNTFITSVVGGLAYFLVVLFIEDIYNETFKSLNLNNFILLGTLIAIVWYSLETRLLKNATNVANTIQSEPLLVLQYEGENLYIINYGKGPAFNIEMKIKNIKGFFNFSIPNPNSLGHMEKKFLLPLNNESLNQNVEAEITLSFDNFENKEGTTRKRIYRISTAKEGYSIRYIG